MKTADFRNDCFALFLTGMSLRAIAKEKKVSRSAIERWCSKDNWVDQRALYWNDLKDRTMKEQYKNEIKLRASLSTEAFDAMMQAFTEIRLVSEGKMPKRAMIFKRSSIRWLCNTFIQSLTAEQLAVNKIMRDIEYEKLLLEKENLELRSNTNDR